MNLAKERTSRDKAYSAIKRAIFRGKFGPGYRLKEEELAEYCRVSRTPIRDAIRMLASEGFVSIEKNRGAVVADVTEAHAEQIFDLLSMLESYAAGLAAETIGRDRIAELRALNQQMKELVRDAPADDVKFVELNSRFHRLVHADVSNTTLTDMLSRIIDLPTQIYFKLGHPTESAWALPQHDAIIDALERRDKAFAELTTKHHVESIRRDFRLRWIVSDPAD